MPPSHCVCVSTHLRPLPPRSHSCGRRAPFSTPAQAVSTAFWWLPREGCFAPPCPCCLHPLSPCYNAAVAGGYIVVAVVAATAMVAWRLWRVCPWRPWVGLPCCLALHTTPTLPRCGPTACFRPLPCPQSACFEAWLTWSQPTNVPWLRRLSRKKPWRRPLHPPYTPPLPEEGGGMRRRRRGVGLGGAPYPPPEALGSNLRSVCGRWWLVGVGGVLTPPSPPPSNLCHSSYPPFHPGCQGPV